MLQQECDVAFNNSVENYTESLRKYFAQREEPFEVPQLFEILKESRDSAIDQFDVIGEVREKYANYDQYVNRVQQYINEQEGKIIAINENKAEK